MNTKDAINLGIKSYFRGGNILKNILKRSEKHLTAEDVLIIHNTYGIRIEQLPTFIYSHGFTFNEDEFVNLYDSQPKPKMIECCKVKEDEKYKEDCKKPQEETKSTTE